MVFRLIFKNILVLSFSWNLTTKSARTVPVGRARQMIRCGSRWYGRVPRSPDWFCVEEEEEKRGNLLKGLKDWNPGEDGAPRKESQGGHA